MDERLRATERVLTVATAAGAVAYPFELLEQLRVVNDEHGDLPLRVLFRPGTSSALDADRLHESRAVGSAAAFSRRVDGRTLTFETAGADIVDRETRSRWDITGRSVAGPRSGRRLDPVIHGNHLWFAWAIFQPDTRIYRP